jgi:hypothetical protein
MSTSNDSSRGAAVSGVIEVDPSKRKAKAAALRKEALQLDDDAAKLRDEAVNLEQDEDASKLRDEALNLEKRAAKLRVDSWKTDGSSCVGCS